ncbi:MAG: phytoene/squalene synthase family protein [Pirellulales bacterium]|nr:phytoene/squalene synthase family protein [Pirellulales bacterium]
MKGDNGSVEASYSFCRQLARRSGSSFYPCFLLLGREKRRGMDALYAFMRHTDDLVDSREPVASRQRALGHWRILLSEALSGAGVPLNHPLMPALADAVRRFQIPPEHLHAVIDGVEMDLEARQYETFDDLAAYCRRVASAVGIACLHVWGFRGDGALAPADKCGLAFQLTNILRDLKEDVQQGRIYLPLEDFRESGYSPEALAAGVADERFLSLVERQLDRAEGFYREAAELFDWLERDGRRVFGMMTSLYYAILAEIRRRPTAVLSRRVRLPGPRKIRVAARWLLLPPKQLAFP